jgi:hypothetical protein
MSAAGSNQRGKNSEIDRPIFPHFSAVVIWAS